MRTVPLLLASLLLLAAFSWVYPIAEAASPKALKLFSGSLDPAEIKSFSWRLNRDLSEYLFYYDVTGGTDQFDVIYVSIDETLDHWDWLMGKGWTYCACPVDAGDYTVTVEADGDATGTINFNAGFYLVPQPPVDFAGFIPASSDVRTSDFGLLFPSTTSYTIVLGATAGSYEFFVDGTSEGVVAGTTNLALDLQEGFHLFEASSIAVSVDEDVRWTVQFQGQPKLEVSIVDVCPVLNPESAQSVCVTGAAVTASDGGNPTVSYAWTASGGQFNSTTSQWVEWTAPPGVASFSLTVEASAPGYVSDSDSLTVRVEPEFPSSVVPLVLMLALVFTALAQRRSRRQQKA